MELVSDAKDGVMRNESTVGFPCRNHHGKFHHANDGEFMNSPSFASFPIIPGFTMEFSMLVEVLGLWKDDLRSAAKV